MFAPSSRICYEVIQGPFFGVRHSCERDEVAPMPGCSHADQATAASAVAGVAALHLLWEESALLLYQSCEAGANFASRFCFKGKV